jgi:hypothetical protein
MVSMVSFYIDKTGAVIEPTVNNPGTITTGTRIPLAMSGITTPNGDTLDNYTIVRVEVQLFLNSIWGPIEGFIYATAGFGTTGGVADETSIVFQAGGGGVATDTTSAGGVHNYSGGPIGTVEMRGYIVAYK